MLSITGTEVVIWDIMRLGDFEKYVFLLEISRVFCLFFLAENKKFKCSIKCHPCGDVESNPGPNLLNLQTFEGYKNIRQMQTCIHVLLHKY